MKIINQKLYDFIWAVPNKMKSTVIVKEYNEDGMNMMGICSFKKIHENYMA